MEASSFMFLMLFDLVWRPKSADHSPVNVKLLSSQFLPLRDVCVIPPKSMKVQEHILFDTMNNNKLRIQVSLYQLSQYIVLNSLKGTTSTFQEVKLLSICQNLALVLVTTLSAPLSPSDTTASGSNRLLHLRYALYLCWHFISFWHIKSECWWVLSVLYFSEIQPK